MANVLIVKNCFVINFSKQKGTYNNNNNNKAFAMDYALVSLYFLVLLKTIS